MPDVMTFSTFDRAQDGSTSCSLCSAGPIAIHYSVSSDDGVSNPLSGYCCMRCAVNLLSALEQRQSTGAAMALAKNPNFARPPGSVLE
jgi:hypothetical protein